MTFDDYIIMGYEVFGPEAMQVANQFFIGDIDFQTCVDCMKNTTAHYYMQKEINDNKPKKIKVTTAFAEYLKATTPLLPERPNKLTGGIIGHFPGTPIEIDDEIDGHYEFVY